MGLTIRGDVLKGARRFQYCDRGTVYLLEFCGSLRSLDLWLGQFGAIRSSMTVK